MSWSNSQPSATSPQMSVFPQWLSRGLIRRTLIAASAALLASAAAAYASPITVTGTYTVTVTPTPHTNAPSITTPALASPFTESLNLGVPTTPTTFFTAAPAASCGSNAAGSPCRTSNTATGTISVNFNFSLPNSQTAGATANYTENYNNMTDSLIWTSSPIVVNFSGGAVLDVILGNFIDWDMKPTISFELMDAPAIPEPTSLALFGTALAALGLIRRRRRA